MNDRIDPKLYQEVAKLGAMDMEICMQCGACSASCPLSSGTHTFPRKFYRYLQLGLKDKLLASAEPWLCYYCGECNKSCPRGAEPAETMMASRRWLITQYDWTGLSKRFYTSPAWEVGAFLVVALGIIALFLFGHGPVVTERVELNTFAPVAWIQFGDKCMLSILGALLFSNGFRMFRRIMGDMRPPFLLYIKEIKTFVMHYFTQMRWRSCGAERQNRWLKHLLLFSGYVTMEVLVVAFLGEFQTDVVHPFWHPTRVFGYYATVVLMIISAEMLISRTHKKEDLHRYSDFTDWFFLVLLFSTAFSGIFVHIFRLAGWPLITYGAYVVHLAIAVGMLCIMLPFGKLSHLFYRPLAIFLATVREKASAASTVALADVKAEIGDVFLSCLQCGTCTSLCPVNRVGSYSPRRILRQLTLESGTKLSLEQAAWGCVTCYECTAGCPRGIDIIDVIRKVRGLNVDGKSIPRSLEAPLKSLKENGNPWGKLREKRMEWAGGMDLPDFKAEHEYCLFACCTTAYDPDSQFSGQAIVRLLEYSGVAFGSLGTRENCCGDPAHQTGAEDIFRTLQKQNIDLFLQAGVNKILTTSPHCLTSFKKSYAELKDKIHTEHYTEVLDRLIREGRLKPCLKLDRTVTYHDPCYLGRHNGIYDAPRRVLLSIPGITLVEMADNKESSLCCGGGGGGAWSKDLSIKDMGVLRVEEALGAGAEVIATACPYCIRMLNAAVKRLNVGDRIVVKDLAELLLQSVVTKDKANIIGHIDLGISREVCHV